MFNTQAMHYKTMLDDWSDAAGRFDDLHQHAIAGRVWSRLTRRPYRLLNLTEAQQAWSVGERHAGGVRMVPIMAIRGSEGRSADFDAHFRPLNTHTRTRWTGLAEANDRGVSFPPVELVQSGDVYFVRDGHHRISVANAFGQREIEAEVTVWECRAAVEAPVKSVRVQQQLGQRLLVWTGDQLMRAGAKLHAVAQAAPHPVQG
jgi:hypothetical protein